MSSGERPIGAANGKQTNTRASCQPPPPPSPRRLDLPPPLATGLSKSPPPPWALAVRAVYSRRDAGMESLVMNRRTYLLHALMFVLMIHGPLGLGPCAGGGGGVLDDQDNTRRGWNNGASRTQKRDEAKTGRPERGGGEWGSND